MPRRDRQDAPACSSAASVCNVCLELGRERPERARDEADRPVRMTAGTASLDLSAPACEMCALVAGFEPGRSLERSRDSSETVHAWSALAGALSGEVARDTRGL